MSIYAATLIHADIDSVWRHTQDPQLLVRWDRRLSTLRYLPRGKGERQRFEFTTPLGFSGHGHVEGMASEEDGTRTVEMHFRVGWLMGRLVWQYVPTDDGVRLLTRIALRPRLLERLLKLPLTWVTARALTRLRGSLEAGRI